MRKLILMIAASLVLTACGAGKSNAGESHLKGKIFITAANGEIINFPDVQIGLYPKDGKGLRVTKTNDNGEFEFRVPKGRYVVQATAYRALPDNKAEPSNWREEINLDEDEETITLNSTNRW